jgi:hypothetical protein
MNTHVLTIANLAAILGCISAIGCASTSAPAAAHAPISQARTAGQACVVVQRGATGDVRDTRIAEQWPDANYGASDATFAGQVGHGERDALLAFSFAGLPEGAVVTKATLTLHKGVCGGSGVEIHRVTQAWDERTATWKSFARGYDPAIEAELSTGIPGEPGAVSADVTALVQDWVTGASPNLGVLLRREAGNTSFATSEATSPADRPELEICYAVPAT